MNVHRVFVILLAMSTSQLLGEEQTSSPVPRPQKRKQQVEKTKTPVSKGDGGRQATATGSPSPANARAKAGIHKKCLRCGEMYLLVHVCKFRLSNRQVSEAEKRSSGSSSGVSKGEGGRQKKGIGQGDGGRKMTNAKAAKPKPTATPRPPKPLVIDGIRGESADDKHKD